MACIDLRALSLKSPSRYCVAAARWGARLKQALKASMNVPKRCSSARADLVVTPRIVEKWRDQYKSGVSGPIGRRYQSSVNRCACDLNYVKRFRVLRLQRCSQARNARADLRLHVGNWASRASRAHARTPRMRGQQRHVGETGRWLRSVASGRTKAQSLHRSAPALVAPPPSRTHPAGCLQQAHDLRLDAPSSARMPGDF